MKQLRVGKVFFQDDSFTEGATFGFEDPTNSSNIRVRATLKSAVVSLKDLCAIGERKDVSRTDWGASIWRYSYTIYGYVTREFTVALPFGGSYEFSTETYEKVGTVSNASEPLDTTSNMEVHMRRDLTDDVYENLVEVDTLKHLFPFPEGTEYVGNCGNRKEKYLSYYIRHKADGSVFLIEDGNINSYPTFALVSCERLGAGGWWNYNQYKITLPEGYEVVSQTQIDTETREALKAAATAAHADWVSMKFEKSPISRREGASVLILRDETDLIVFNGEDIEGLLCVVHKTNNEYSLLVNPLVYYTQSSDNQIRVLQLEPGTFYALEDFSIEELRELSFSRNIDTDPATAANSVINIPENWNTITCTDGVTALVSGGSIRVGYFNLHDKLYAVKYFSGHKSDPTTGMLPNLAGRHTFCHFYLTAKEVEELRKVAPDTTHVYNM